MSVRSARYNRLSLRSPKGTSALPRERDAWAFLDAAGITSSRQQEAVIQLVRDLKGYGLWSKMKAIYPFVGGTATTHKWNLKDPRDANAAFRLTFSGGWTHGGNGILGNGVNNYANTFFYQEDNLSTDSIHTSVYARDKSTSIIVFIGTSGTYYDSTNIASLGTGYDVLRGYSNCSFPDRAEVSDTTRTGLIIATRRDSSNHYLYRNTIRIKDKVASGVTPWPNTKYTFYIGAYNDGGAANYFCNATMSLATIGDGLTDTDATNLYNAVDRYQKFLGRAV